jgi:hypothetical protein
MPRTLPRTPPPLVAEPGRLLPLLCLPIVGLRPGPILHCGIDNLDLRVMHTCMLSEALGWVGGSFTLVTWSCG